MERIIGIDFGTSTTYMNVKRYNGVKPDGDKFSYIPVMFNYGESSGYVATIVRENADGSFDFGEKASEPLEGAKIHTEIKMRLESPDEQERAEARRITREFFRFLYEQYAQQAANLGGADDEEETVVSYPVKWQKETAQFMLDAARDAGFQKVRGMDEAEAAVATVLCQNSGNRGLIYADKPGYLMLVDMGAGTTDLVVCRYQANPNGEIAIELVTSWPYSADEPTFGGREIDKVLEQYVADYLTKSLLNQNLLPIARDFATKPGESKKWKERHVSVNLADGKPVATCGYVSPLRSMLSADFPAFDRTGFETLVESGLQDYAHLISGCLEKTAEVDENFSGLDLVILTGGHSAWYFAKEILTGAMEGWLDHPALAAVRDNPYRVVSLPNPQTTVSLGLVYSKLPFDLWKQTGEEPAAEVDPPQIEEMQRFLIQAMEDGYFEFFLMDLSTGLRRGELLALQWDDLNFNTGELRITKQVARIRGKLTVSEPKTKAAIRTIILPPAIVDMLKAYKGTMESRWMFPSPKKEDSPLDPASVRKRLCKTLERAGCKRVRFHDLRHTFATTALEYGMDVKTLSTVIGHNSVSTTLNIYAHITDDMRATAAVNIDRGIAKQEQTEMPEKKAAPEKTETDFVATKGQRKKPGTGCLSQIGERLWEGKYSPRGPDGKKRHGNVYAHTREECEEKLKVLIQEMKAEIAAEWEQLKKVA